MMGHMFMDVYHVWDPTMRMFNVKGMGLSWYIDVKIEVEKPRKKHMVILRLGMVYTIRVLLK